MNEDNFAMVYAGIGMLFLLGFMERAPMYPAVVIKELYLLFANLFVVMMLLEMHGPEIATIFNRHFNTEDTDK